MRPTPPHTHRLLLSRCSSRLRARRNIGHYYGTLVFVNMTLEGRPKSPTEKACTQLPCRSSSRIPSRFYAPAMRSCTTIPPSSRSTSSLLPSVPLRPRGSPPWTLRLTRRCTSRPKTSYTMDDAFPTLLFQVRATKRIPHGDLIFLSSRVEFK